MLSIFAFVLLVLSTLWSKFSSLATAIKFYIHHCEKWHWSHKILWIVAAMCWMTINEHCSNCSHQGLLPYRLCKWLTIQSHMELNIIRIIEKYRMRVRWVLHENEPPFEVYINFKSSTFRNCLITFLFFCRQISLTWQMAFRKFCSNCPNLFISFRLPHERASRNFQQVLFVLSAPFQWPGTEGSFLRRINTVSYRLSKPSNGHQSRLSTIYDSTFPKRTTIRTTGMTPER